MEVYYGNMNLYTLELQVYCHNMFLSFCDYQLYDALLPNSLQFILTVCQNDTFHVISQTS